MEKERLLELAGIEQLNEAEAGYVLYYKKGGDLQYVSTIHAHSVGTTKDKKKARVFSEKEYTTVGVPNSPVYSALINLKDKGISPKSVKVLDEEGSEVHSWWVSL